MNNRIKEIAEKAGMTDDKFGMFFAKDNHNEDGVDLAKFADLIIQECANFIDISIGDGGIDGQILKEHFGVKS